MSSLKIFIISYAVLLMNTACATEVIVDVVALEVTPNNIKSTGICVSVFDYGSPDVSAEISVPKILDGLLFNTFGVTVNYGLGESTTIESSPALKNGRHKIFVSSIQDDGGLSGIEVEVTYGGKAPDLLVQSISLGSFLNANAQSKSQSNCES